MTDAATPHHDAQDALAPLRQRIDELDASLVELLNERAKVVVEVGRVKKGGNTPIYVPERERQVLERIAKLNAGPLPNTCLEAIWRELMSGSFALERPLRVGHLGPIGSFSHLAARKKFGASVEYDSLDDIHAVFEAIERGHIDYGLAPIENSAIGGVGESLDAFLTTNVRVCAEVLITIHHNLLSHSPPETITKIYSKPEVLGQCRKWLSVQLHQAEKIPTASSSKAAEIASKELQSAAIGSSLAAEIYNLQIQFANIEDNPRNVTRFFVIGKQSARPTGDDKTSIMFTTEHKPGTLVNVLDVIRDFGINLTHIDKRPSQRVNWEYIFFVDLVGHADEPNVAAAIREAGKHCLQLTVLGSYPRAVDVL